MKRNTFFKVLLAIGTLLSLGGTLLMVGRALARGPGDQGPGLSPSTLLRASGSEGVLSPQQAVGTAFTYQGRLLDNGTPINGNLDLYFTLWDAPDDGSLIGEQAATGVAVSDGTFSVPLDFGSEAFTGDARYLGIEVEGTPLEPRVELTAAPYAHGLRPGAVINSSTGTALTLNSSGGGATVSVSNAEQDGLLVTSAGDDGLQVSSANYGVYVSSATHDALKVANAGDDGLDIYDAGDAPTHTLPADFWPYENTHDGIDIAGARDYGLWVGYAGEDGVHVLHADHYGVRVNSSDGIGVYASAAGDGAYVTGGDDGVHVGYAGDDGVYIEYVGGDGIELGIAGGYGLNMPSDGILVNGCTGCTSMFVAQNGDGRDLVPGDVVVISGVGEPFGDNPDPTLLVRRAEESGSPAVAGVVNGRITAVEETKESGTPDGQGESTTHMRILPPEEAPAGPGEYLVIVTMGMARVKVDASAGSIHPGDLLTASGSSGLAKQAQPMKVGTASFYPPGTIIGKAMEPLEKGSGLIWALVTLQ